MFLKILDTLRISQHFLINEFMCHCGCGEVLYSYRVVKGLERMRHYFSLPTKYKGQCKIVVKVGLRCKAFNERLIALYNAGKYPNKPAANTWHFRGAVDIHVYIRTDESEPWEKVDTGEVDRVAKLKGFRGRGIYKTFNHLDMRLVKSFWDKR